MLKVLATLDGSVFSQAVLPVLERLCGELRAEIFLITVVAEPALRSQDASGPDFRASADSGVAQGVSRPLMGEPPEPHLAETSGQAIDRVIDESRIMLEEAAVPLRQHGDDIRIHAIVSDDPAAAIIQAARDHKVDLIAMATHGRTGLRSVLQGSIASQVLALGVAPVLLVRPEQ